MGGRVRQYIKYNVNDDYNSLECEANTCNPSFWDWRYRYSPLGGREQKRLYYSPHSDGCEGYTHPWTYYLRGAYGEQLALYYGRQTQEDDTCGNTGQRVYIYPNSYITNGGELVTRADGTKEFSVTDHLGSVRAVVNDQDTTVLSYSYKPFGDTLSTSAGDVARIGFIGQEQDIEHGYFNMGARYYDPEIGRFLSVDPLFEMYTEYTPYNYCNNSPMMFRDPSGMGLVEEIVDGCESIVRSIHEWLFGSDANPLEPGDDGLFGNRGGGGSGSGGDNGLPERGLDEGSTVNVNSPKNEFGLRSPAGGHVGGKTQNSEYKSAPFKVAGIDIDFASSENIGNALKILGLSENNERSFKLFYNNQTNEYMSWNFVVGERYKIPYYLDNWDLPLYLKVTGWEIIGTAHNHPNNMPLSNQDLDYYWGIAIDQTKEDRIFDGQIHVVETNDTRYVLVIDNAQMYHQWYIDNLFYPKILDYPRPKGKEKQEKYLNDMLNNSMYKRKKFINTDSGVRFNIIRK